MKKVFLFLLFLLFVPNYAVLAEEEEDMNKKFNEWLISFKKMANEEYSISKDLLDRAFANVKYKERVVKLDRNQPEFKKVFWNYYDDAIHPLRIKRGKDRLQQNIKLLRAVEKKYGVPPSIIVAFWGMETDYGRNMGKTPIIEALATLSFDNRRQKFFTNELINSLKLIQDNKVNADDFLGSWAGGFGNFQFIPSTIISYAVDGDGDGKIDLRDSLPDAFYSAGNYLSKMGWDKNYRWGRPVKFNKNNKKIWEIVNSKNWYDLSYFSQLGITRTNGNRLPTNKIKGQLIAPMGMDGPVFLVYKNFNYIKRWNNSTNYALSVGLLSDAITDNKIGKIQPPKKPMPQTKKTAPAKSPNQGQKTVQTINKNTATQNNTKQEKKNPLPATKNTKK